jgi:hypothetical protein
MTSGNVPREAAWLQRSRTKEFQAQIGRQELRNSDRDLVAFGRIHTQESEVAVVNLLRLVESPTAIVFCHTREAVRHLSAGSGSFGVDGAGAAWASGRAIGQGWGTSYAKSRNACMPMRAARKRRGWRGALSSQLISALRSTAVLVDGRFSRPFTPSREFSPNLVGPKRT